jgi:SpoVK/Ycf46/Vps4 family AAA+-type ATPase
MNAGPVIAPYIDNAEHLVDELRWLDVLIGLRTKTLALQGEAAPETQVARTAYITSAEVEWLLAEHAARPRDDEAVTVLRSALAKLRGNIDDRVAQSLVQNVDLALPRLCFLFGLSPFEHAAIVILLAPELRRTYDRVYAYLQDDLTRKRPSVDLILTLLCDGERARWEAQQRFSDGATMLRAALVEKVIDPHHPSGSSSLSQYLKLDPRICAFLMGHHHPDARLAELTRWYEPSSTPNPLPMDAEVAAGLWRLIEQHLGRETSQRSKLVLYFHGPHGIGKRELSLHIGRRLNCRLLTIDADTLLARGAEAEGLLRLAFREALLQGALLLVERADLLLQDSARVVLSALQTAISDFGWLVLLAGRTPWIDEKALSGCFFHATQLSHPDVPVRMAMWKHCLADQLSAAADQSAQLAAKFRLTPGQIRAAVDLARAQSLLKPGPKEITTADLTKACREQSNQRLREFAVKVDPHYGWDDLVLPQDKLVHLREICDQVRHQYLVFGDWGFGKKLGHGKGLSILFSGVSGTGKTMAAEVLAGDLELDLYKVDLSGVVSKFIGETEKNLARIFAEAETSNAVLFFDEADALFGKRTEVSDAHDRYANIETSYLLQKMEEYKGVVILATNLRENMDDAFARRIRFVVEFPFPNEASRERIWQTHFPAEAPVSLDVDCQKLAQTFQIAGGTIKNIVLNAAFLAAADGVAISPQHLLHGTKREFEKAGKQWRDRRS